MLRPAGGDPGSTCSSSKVFFWQFVFPWVDLALLKPVKNFPLDKFVIRARKNKATSCSFLVAIRRCSCGRLADWLKIDGRENPVSTLETGRHATLRFAAPSFSHLESLSSLLGSLRKQLKTKFTPAVSSVYKHTHTHTHSLSPSLSAWVHSRKEIMCAQHSWSEQKFAKPQFQIFSFFSGLRVQHVEVRANCALDEDSAGCWIENEAPGSSYFFNYSIIQQYRTKWAYAWGQWCDIAQSELCCWKR